MPNRANLKIGEFVLDPSRNLLIGPEGETVLEAKVVDVLVALAAQPGAVLSRDELIDAVWKTEFGADERLTRAISMLRKALHDERGTTQYIETVSKRGYRLVATVEQAGETESAPASEVTQPPPSRPWHAWQAYAVAGFFGALAIVGVAATLWRDSNSLASPYVAVLPFDDLSPQQEGKVFAEGLAEEILYALSKSSDIAVAARSSSFKFTTRQAGEAAKALDATHLVEGTVRKDGERVRVAVLLKETRSQTAIWSETFERPVTQLLQVQDDIAWRVADALGARLTRIRDAPTVEPATYERYLCARDLLRLRRVDSAVEFEAVVEREPNFVRAWAGLAVARHLRSGSSEAPQVELVAAAQKAIDRTLELDPHNGEVLGVLAQKMLVQGRFREAEVLFDRALASEPNNATLLNWRYIFYGNVGRSREAMAVISRAYGLDRLSPAFSGNLANALTAAGRFAEAKAMLDAGVVESDWDGTYILDTKRDLLAYSGDWNALARYMKEPQFGAPAQFAETYALIGETAAVLTEKKEIAHLYFRQRWKDVVAGHSLRRQAAIEYLSYIGDVDGAMDHLQGLFAGPERWQELSNAFFPFAASLRKDRRFIALMDTVGLWDYWRESGHWPDFCAEPGLPYDCKAEGERLKASR